jgi:hypothetical protein
MSRAGNTHDVGLAVDEVPSKARGILGDCVIGRAETNSGAAALPGEQVYEFPHQA